MRRTSEGSSEAEDRVSRYYAIASTFLLLAATIIIYYSEFRTRVSLSYPSPRLVFLYATCSLNKNYLSPYNSSIKYTPHFAEFAKSSVVFLRHESESSFSGAGFASLFTGQPVYRHRVYYHPKPLSSNLYMIGEAFHDNGYDVFYLNGHDMATENLNYAQGVSHKNVIEWVPGDAEKTKGRDLAIDSVLDQLKSNPNYKALIIMNFSRTHAPYTNNSPVPVTESFCRDFPQECEGITNEDFQQYVPLYEKNHVNLQFHFDETIHSMGLNPDQVSKMAKVIEASYKSSVRILDERFGRMMQRLAKANMLNDSLIAFTSDHGEVLYRPDAHIAWTHSCSHNCLEPESLNIALMIRLPNGTAAGKYQEVTRAMDVYPTLVGLSGMKLMPQRQVTGKDLSGAILGKNPRTDLLAFSCGELIHPSVHQDDPRKADVALRIHDNLYVLHSNPGGSPYVSIMDLWDYRAIPKENDFNFARARSLLFSYKEEVVKNYKPANDQENWNEHLEKLRSLGYLN